MAREPATTPRGLPSRRTECWRIRLSACPMFFDKPASGITCTAAKGLAGWSQMLPYIFWGVCTSPVGVSLPCSPASRAGEVEGMAVQSAMVEFCEDCVAMVGLCLS